MDKPNYIQLVNRFWEVNLEYDFTGNETRLYFFLLHLCNSLAWKNPFRHSLRQTERATGIKMKLVDSARERLAEAGLIKFKPGKRGNRYDNNNKAEYYIPVVKNTTGATTAKVTDVHTGTDTLNKLKETKQLFNEFREEYPGNKRALDVEWNDFIKKNHNYLEIVPRLMPALEAENQHRDALSEKKKFVPPWKHLRTWLNKKCWTEEFPEQDEQNKQGLRSHDAPLI